MWGSLVIGGGSKTWIRSLKGKNETEGRKCSCSEGLEGAVRLVGLSGVAAWPLEVRYCAALLRDMCRVEIICEEESMLVWWLVTLSAQWGLTSPG